MVSQFRYANILLGLWLFISAFAWPHSHASFTNTWIMGIIVAFVALLALSIRQVRFVNTVSGIWLVVSAFLLPRLRGADGVGTVLNNLIVGILVFGLSLAGGSVTRGKPVRTT
ncbi:MAG TPA: SPW repeat protein [Polyangia bacterium]|nr:SPW repeat protein [Polyangia bacterium]